MNNKEKHDIIANLNTYWAETHPDCFLEYPDGRKIFRDDLLSYKQDLMLRDVYASKNGTTPVVAAPVKSTNVKPLWICIAVLTLLQVAQIVFHI